MKSLAFATLLLISFGCKSEKKIEDCTHNGVKVDCASMDGRRDQKPRDVAEVEVFSRGSYEIKNGKFKALTTMSKEVTKKVGDTTFGCMIDMPKGTESDVTANEREIIFTREGQASIYSRVTSGMRIPDLFLGKFESFDKPSNMKTQLNFLNKDTMEITVTCSFK